MTRGNDPSGPKYYGGSSGGPPLFPPFPRYKKLIKDKDCYKNFVNNIIRCIVILTISFILVFGGTGSPFAYLFSPFLLEETLASGFSSVAWNLPIKLIVISIGYIREIFIVMLIISLVSYWKMKKLEPNIRIKYNYIPTAIVFSFIFYWFYIIILLFFWMFATLISIY